MAVKPMSSMIRALRIFLGWLKATSRVLTASARYAICLMLASYRRMRKVSSEGPTQEDSRSPNLVHRNLDDHHIVVRHEPDIQTLDYAASYLPTTMIGLSPGGSVQSHSNTQTVVVSCSPSTPPLNIGLPDPKRILSPNIILPDPKNTILPDPKGIAPKLFPATASDVRRYERRVKLKRKIKKSRSKSKEREKAKGNQGANQNKANNMQSSNEKGGQKNGKTKGGEAEEEEDEDLNWDLPPGTQDYSSKEQDGWKSCVHPEGALYFFHSASRVYTDYDVREPHAAETLQLCINSLRDELTKLNITLSSNIDVMMDLVKTGKKWACKYYLINHETRCLFWVHPMNTGRLVGHVKGITHAAQLRFALETQYWKHVEYYPHEQTLKKEIYEEFADIVVHANAEAITSSTYLAPFDKEELSKMLDLMGALNEGKKEGRPYFTCVIARMMRLFANIRFFNFCGQPGARLDADQSVYAKSKIELDRKSALLAFMNLILFGAPEAHINGLQKVWVDETVNHARWTDFTNNLYNEWNGFTIYSTVMLAVDVSFLAVPGVDPGNPVQQTLATIAIYLSTMNAVGSLVISLLLVGQSRKKGRESMENAATFMSRMTKTRLRTESLGIMYSLPYALLMWGMVWFIVALSFTMFRTSEAITRAAVGIDWAIIAAFVLLPVWASKEGTFIEAYESWRSSRAIATQKNKRKPEKKVGANGASRAGGSPTPTGRKQSDPEQGKLQLSP